jgi:hypothetical protein
MKEGGRGLGGEKTRAVGWRVSQKKPASPTPPKSSSYKTQGMNGIRKEGGKKSRKKDKRALLLNPAALEATEDEFHCPRFRSNQQPVLAEGVKIKIK